MNPKLPPPLLLLMLMLHLMAICPIQPSSAITDDDLVRRYLPPPNWPFTQKELTRHFQVIRPVQSANALSPKDYRNLKRTNHFTVTPTERTPSSRKIQPTTSGKPKIVITRG